MRIKYTLTSCVDCIAFVANGDIPEERPDLAADILLHLGSAEDMRNLVNADGCDESGDLFRDDSDQPIDGDHPDYEVSREEWFSWSACECCGSHLGGNRNRLAVLTCEPESV